MSLLASFFYLYYFGIEVDTLIAFVLLTMSALLSVSGDLMLSLVKRGLEVKDFGSIFPGHGGALDRIDGALMAAPAIYSLLYLI